MASRRLNSGELDVGNLRRYWRLADEYERQMEQQQATRQGLRLTARKLDEAQPAGTRVYIGHTRRSPAGSSIRMDCERSC